MKISTRKIAVAGVFAAIAAILMYFEFPIPFIPPFLKIDLSNVPILLGAFLFGPWYAVAMAFIKDVVHTFSSTTGGVGQLADFIMTSAYAVTAGMVYRTSKSRTGAFIACIAGTVAITIAGALANFYILIPFYAKIMPLEVIWSLCAKVNPIITDLPSYILYGVIPFNLIKGTLISLLTFFLYKKLSGFIKTIL